MKRLETVFDVDDAASCIFYSGLNHVCYSLPDGDKDEAVAYGSAYYVHNNEYAEHPQYVPMKQGEFRPGPKCIFERVILHRSIG